MARTAVIALGGNALSPPGESGTYDEQMQHAVELVTPIVAMIERGWRIVVVHGNGPQVGSLALQQTFPQARIADVVCRLPLFSLGAMTQGEIGSMLSLALRQQLGGAVSVASIVSHVVVGGDDPSFDAPTKPIGPFFDRDESERLATSQGWTMIEDSGRGYRRVVASPEPLDVLEGPSIRALVEAGTVVIACGGGGVPVSMTPEGYAGVEAVIDKDLVACRLAESLGAQAVAFLTGVANAAVDFGLPTQRPLHVVDVAAAEKFLAEGQFPPGSMGPKVEAAIRFVRSGGADAVITMPALLLKTLEYQASVVGPCDVTHVGTRIVSSTSQSLIA